MILASPFPPFRSGGSPGNSPQQRSSPLTRISQLALSLSLALALTRAFISPAPQAHAQNTAPQNTAPQSTAPQTVAERSHYQATSRHQELLDFIQTLAAKDPRLKVTSFGKSVEGRELPLVIVADPAHQSPATTAPSRQPTILFFANIHAGEVDGKEALLMLLRELIDPAQKQLLSQVTLLVVPNLNPDGNERFDEGNRPHQDGPSEGLGTRENAQGLDLNRDYVKLESPEVRALVQLVRQWQPHLVVDCHTTNGSWHRHTITYDANRHPAGDQLLIRLARTRLLPAAATKLQELGGWHSFYYGNFNREHTAWETFPLQPRFGTHYFSLGPQLAVLVESYSHATYKDRVLATRDYCRALIQVTVEQRELILSAIAAAERQLAGNAHQNASNNSASTDERADNSERLTSLPVPLQVSPAPLPDQYRVLGYEERDEQGQPVRTDIHKEYPVTFWGGASTKLAVTRPAAYLIPPGYPLVIETLQRHGITVQQLREDLELDLQIYRVDQRQTASETFQGHRATQLSVTRRDESRMISAGWFVVRTNSSLGQLTSYLLEPQSDDGLTHWNFFDQLGDQPALAVGTDFPVFRLPTWSPLLLAPLPTANKQQSAPQTVTMASLYDASPAGPNSPRSSLNLSGNPVSPSGWSPAGNSYLQLREGRLYQVGASSGRLAPLVSDPRRLRKSLAALTPIGDKAAATLARFSPNQLNPAHTAILINHDNDLYHARLDGSAAVRLTSTTGKEELSSFSPDGKYVAFVRDNDLYVVDVDSQTERRLTTDGSQQVFNGKADWVYYEEIFQRNYRCYWWSPDSRRIAFLRIDDSPVHPFAVLDPIPPRQKVELTPYPKAGDPLPLVSVGVVTAAGGSPVFADLQNYSPTDRLISRATFTADSSGVIAYVLNRKQTWLDLVRFDFTTGQAQRLFRETTKAWVDDPGPPEFLNDGSFLFLSERDGYKHLYHYSAAGQLQKQLTSGPWQIRKLHKVDQKTQWIYFSATKDNPIGSQLYRVKLDGSQLELLTDKVGTHQFSFAPAGPFYWQSVSSRTQPTRIYCGRLDDWQSQAQAPGKRVIDLNPVWPATDYLLGRVEPLQIPLADGFVLEAQLTYPPDFDAQRARRYPVWVKTYGGPNAPTVRDAWSGDKLENQAHAAAGFLVLEVDPRPASGKGALTTWTAYRQLGKQELADLEEAVQWLCRRPYVDERRIGLSGYSYGGYLTCYALTHSKLFAAGVAGAPVTDWRNYDAIYTERYMDTPQDNPAGYDAASVVKAAQNLHGKLLLVHGAMDDNVHLQNVLQLLGAFQAADRYCELQVYPRARHGVGGKHFPKLAFEFMTRHLQP